MPDTSQGVSVGDAVLEFLADTTKLDQGLDNLGTKVEVATSRAATAFTGFDDAVERTKEGFVGFDGFPEEIEQLNPPIEEVKVNLREARGEAMLLGEAIGIRLPRHVTSFIATIPGVQEALSAAFAATAVLFILEAVVKLTEKMSDFVSSAFVYTQTMKDADTATGILNATILKSEDVLTKAKKALEEYGKSAHEIEKIRIGDELSDQLKQVQAELDKANEPLKQEPKWWKAALNAASDYFLGTTRGLDDFTARYQAMKNNQTQADKAAEDYRKAAADAQKLSDEKQSDDEQKAIDKFEALQKKQLADYAWYAQEQFLAAGHAFNQLLSDVSHLGVSRNMPDILFGTDFKDKFGQFEDAAKQLGITLRTDLVTNLDAAKKSYDALKASGLASNIEMKEAKAVVDSASTALKNFDSEGQKSILTLTKMGLEIKKGKDDWQAFSTEMGSAISDALASQKNLGQAAKEAVEQELEALSKKAAAQAIYYTGLGFAALASYQFTSAGQYFEAAGILGGIAVGSGLAAGAIGGGGGAGGGSGSGSEGTQPHGAIQTTGSTSQGTVTSTNVQKFAAGALVTQPTMAMIGDAPGGGAANEGVLPLDNPDAMRQIAGAIAEHLSGPASGAGHTFNMWGRVPKRDLKKLVKQISNAANNGTALLHASSTGRITRRSP